MIDPWLRVRLSTLLHHTQVSTPTPVHRTLLTVRMLRNIDFLKQLPAEYFVPTQADNPDGPFVPARQPLVALEPCVIPAYGGEPRGLPTNLEACSAAWMPLMDTEMLPLIGRAVSFEALAPTLMYGDVSALDEVFETRRKVLYFVYSIARVLLVVRDSKLQFNFDLARTLWGDAGIELHGRLSANVPGFLGDDALTDDDRDSFL